MNQDREDEPEREVTLTDAVETGTRSPETHIADRASKGKDVETAPSVTTGTEAHSEPGTEKALLDTNQVTAAKKGKAVAGKTRNGATKGNGVVIEPEAETSADLKVGRGIKSKAKVVVAERSKDKEVAAASKGKGVVIEPQDEREKKNTIERTKKPSLALRSPFNERAVKITARANLVDKEMYYWVLNTKDEHEKAIVYQDTYAKTAKKEFVSLAPFQDVSVAVVDAWSSYLNHMELVKAPETACRLFFSTSPCNNTIVNPPPEWEEHRLFDLFHTRILGEVLAVKSFEWDNYEMIFFPIQGPEHFYLLCFDVAAGKLNVIDNTLAESHESFSAKYGKTPALLRKYLADALVKFKKPKLAGLIRKCSTHLLSMPWRGIFNQVDCGVYLMRHMETFFGEKDKEWECGFTARSTKSVEMLRIKFNTTLLTFERNIRGKVNQNAATRHWKEKPARFSFEKYVQNYGLD